MNPGAPRCTPELNLPNPNLDVYRLAQATMGFSRATRTCTPGNPHPCQGCRFWGVRVQFSVSPTCHCDIAMTICHRPFLSLT